MKDKPVYDNYEISGCRRIDVTGRPNPRGKSVETCGDGDAQFWTLCGHIDGQGVEAIGDFSSREAAEDVHFRITGSQYAGPNEAARLRLMHAAPRLLASLASLVRQADEDCPSELRSRHFVDALEEASDAIAAATLDASLQAVLEQGRSMPAAEEPRHEAKAFTGPYTLRYVDGSERGFYDHTDGWVYYLDSDSKLMATTIDHSEHYAADSWDKLPLTKEERQMIMEGLMQPAAEHVHPFAEVTPAPSERFYHAPDGNDYYLDGQGELIVRIPGAVTDIRAGELLVTPLSESERRQVMDYLATPAAEQPGDPLVSKGMPSQHLDQDKQQMPPADLAKGVPSRDPRKEPYSVLLLYPDNLNYTLTETYYAFVEASDPLAAVTLAQREAVTGLDPLYLLEPRDFVPLLVTEGHHLGRPVLAMPQGRPEAEARNTPQRHDRTLSPVDLVERAGPRSPKLTGEQPPHPWPSEIAKANRQKQQEHDQGKSSGNEKGNGNDNGHSM